MKSIASRLAWILPAGFLIAVLAFAVSAIGALGAPAERSTIIAAPVLDPPGQGNSAVAVLAGGCFWGVQGVFQHVTGVTNAISGYAGGNKKTANYEDVSDGTTGHAEAVQIRFDPRVVSYGQLLHVFYSVVHDPTLLNRQGPDTGPQYRSAIFPVNPQQAEVAKAYIAQLDKSGVFRKPIVTRIESGQSFYPAETYHQDFLTRNPAYPYIAVNDLPKVDALQRIFPALYRAAPVLVASGRPAK